MICIQAIQKNGYEDSSLNDGPKSSWLGYSLLPEGEPPWKNITKLKLSRFSN